MKWDIFKNVRIVILIIALVLALVSLYPNPWAEGVVIKSVARNSSAAEAGFVSPKPTAAPMSREVIHAMNNVPIVSEQDYFEFVDGLKPNMSVQVKTNRGLYRLLVRERFEEIVLNETVLNTFEEVGADNVTRNVSKLVPKVVSVSRGVEDVGLRVGPAPSTNLRKGLDLQGGTRVLLKPKEVVVDEILGLVVDNLQQRLNVYGLSDLLVTTVRDRPVALGSGNAFILVELAGASEEEVRELLSKQGKFEAKVGNTTVFKGGQDVTFVCRTADCSGIDPNRGCRSSNGEWLCGFQFSIALSPDAAQRQADVTAGLEVVRDGGEGYLSEPLKLFLDDIEVDSLSIAEDLKGRAVTEISISGAGTGVSEQDAVTNTLENMKRLQTVLITGSLPVSLEIVKIDTISPVLGSKFLKNAFVMAVLAILAVTVVLMIAYRRWKVAIPIIFTAISEIFMVLGLASLIGWTIDLAAIAGIIVAVGTGVNDQIVIFDETLKRRREESEYAWKERLKRAFFVIFSVYFTNVASMVPLLFAGAGLLKGFAITTILAITVGVFITRPAFAAIVEWMAE